MNYHLDNRDVYDLGCIFCPIHIAEYVETVYNYVKVNTVWP
jgi:hypothetical protein